MCSLPSSLRISKDYPQTPDLERYALLHPNSSVNESSAGCFFESRCDGIRIYLNDCIEREHSQRNIFWLCDSFVSRNDRCVTRSYKVINNASLGTWQRKWREALENNSFELPDTALAGFEPHYSEENGVPFQ